MKRIKLLLVATTLLACMTAAFALDGAANQTILQGLQGSPDQFSTFVSLLENAGLTEALRGPGPVTVLAPTNAAFDDMDQATLTDMKADPVEMERVLNGLIIKGAHSIADLKSSAGATLTPLSGEPYDVEVTGGDLTVNGVGFQAAGEDKEFSNGVVQVTDEVVLPMSLTPVNAGASANAANAAAAAPAAAESAMAFVRVAQLSPMVAVNVVLTPQESGLAATDFGAIAYEHASDYREVQPGKYLLNAALQADGDSLFDAASDTFDSGRYYTIAITGLQLPPEDDDTTDGEGIGGWLRNLFGADGAKRDALAMKATTYEDQVREGATDSNVRVIDAAPGSPAFDLVTVDAADDHHVLVGSMDYGDDSGEKNLPANVTALQITAADSSAVATELKNLAPFAGDSTVFVVGTTFDDAPYGLLILPNGPSAAGSTTSR